MIKKKVDIKTETNTEAPTIPEVYSNAVLTNMTPYEFEITLGLGSSNYEGVKPVVNVRMSPQFAKGRPITSCDVVGINLIAFSG